MKKYQADDQLVNFFLKHGFRETTDKEYPKHAQLLKERIVYDPHSMKRFFVHKRNYNSVYFDYINIIIRHTGSKHNLSFLSLTAQELRSIIAFFSLSSQDRWDLLKKYDLKINELYLLYNDCLKDSVDYKPKVLEQRMIKAFEETVIED